MTQIDLFDGWEKCPHCGYLDDGDAFDVAGVDADTHLFCNKCHCEFDPQSNDVWLTEGVHDAGANACQS